LLVERGGLRNRIVALLQAVSTGKETLNDMARAWAQIAANEKALAAQDDRAVRT
jgi:hypothetical protein